MDTQKPTGEKSAYTGRFGERATPVKRSAPAAPRKQAAEQARRPSGFATTPQKKQIRTSSVPPSKKADVKEPKAPKKKQKRVRPAQPKAQKKLGKPILILLIAALIIYLLIALLFGGNNKTYHQMPTVERESVASFEPETTPLSTMEAP